MLDRATLLANPFIRGIIFRKMRRLAPLRSTGYAAEDVEQELLLVLLQSLDGYDSTHQLHANVFITMVVERATAGILRKHLAKKRAASCCSLDVLFEETGEGEEPSVSRTTAADARSEIDLFDLRHDTAQVLSTLPSDLRDLAERLQRQSLSQAARELGVPIGTLKRRRDRLRGVLENAGFRNFLVPSR